MSDAKSIDTLALANFMRPFFNACFLFLCFVTTQAQQNPCAAYQLTPENSHSGPRQFNVIQLDYSHLSSFVLISDSSGQLIGTGQDGKRVAKLPHAFYEDGDDAIAATGLGPEKEPEEITIQYPQAGEYEISVTSRNSNAQWLRLTFHNCGKHSSKEIEISPGKAGVTVRWHFTYQSSSGFEPKLIAVPSNSKERASRSGEPTRRL